jgi:hypothetical protein
MLTGLTPNKVLAVTSNMHLSAGRRSAKDTYMQLTYSL